MSLKKKQIDGLQTELDSKLESVDLGYTDATRTITNTGGNDTVLPIFTSTNAGLVSGSGGGTTNFLRADGTWAPAGAVDTNLGNTDQTLTADRLVTTGGNTLSFNLGAAPKLFIASDGRVGVNTAFPTAGYQMDVIGSLRAVGRIHATSQLTVVGPVFAGVSANIEGGSSASLRINGNFRQDSSPNGWGYFKNLYVGGSITSAPDAYLKVVGHTATKASFNITGGLATNKPTTPTNGDICYFTNTDATITSIGFWGYENGAWTPFSGGGGGNGIYGGSGALQSGATTVTMSTTDTLTFGTDALHIDFNSGTQRVAVNATTFIGNEQFRVIGGVHIALPSSREVITDLSSGTGYVFNNTSGGNSTTFKFDTNANNKHHNFTFYENAVIRGAFQYDLTNNATRGDGFKFYAKTFATNAETLWLDQATDNVIVPNGNLGIGTALPTQKLHVAGDAYINGETGINSVPLAGTTLILDSTNNQSLRVNRNGTTLFQIGGATSDMVNVGQKLSIGSSSLTDFGPTLDIFGRSGVDVVSFRTNGGVLVPQRINSTGNVAFLDGTSIIDTHSMVTISLGGSSTRAHMKFSPISATQAGTITASDGQLVYVNSTDATFTSVGFWGYENGAWVKL